MEQKSKFQVNAYTPETCSHLFGSLGDQPDPCQRTDIVWHELNTGVQFGICLNCQRQFWPSDPDYIEWRKEPSAQGMSSAGKEEPIGPDEVVVYTTPSTVEGDFDILISDTECKMIIRNPLGQKRLVYESI